jgi:hypothetical protein
MKNISLPLGFTSRFSKFFLLLTLCLCAGLLHAQITNLDDTPNTQWSGQGSNGANFGVANTTTSSTDGQSMRFDVSCGTPPCSYGSAHIWNPNFGPNANTDAATSITNDFFAMMDSTGNTNSQAIQFGIDQAMCTANCSTTPTYTLFRYALQCDFKGSGMWRVWDATSGWVATTHGCVAFTAGSFNHFTFHLSRPNASQVTYVDMVINGTTYPINQTQAAQNEGTTAFHEFTPWVELDGDSATDPYSLWIDQWNISYSGTSSGTTINGIDDDPGTTNTTVANQWISCVNCGGPNTNPPLVTHVGTPPAEDGSAAEFQTNSGSAVDYSGDYWYVQHGGLASKLSTLQYSFDLYVPSQFATNGTIQAIEFECQQTIGGQLFNFGWQDDYNNSHEWRIFNYGTKTWESSGIPFTQFSANTWHHIVANFHINGSQVVHDSITIDGTTYTPTMNNVHNAVAGNGSTFNNAFQLDLNSVGAGYFVYVDNMSVTYTLP